MRIFGRTKTHVRNHSNKKQSWHLPKRDPHTPLKNKKLEAKRREFLRRGGGLSGVYNISDKQTAAFVKEHREFIPDKEIYRKNKKGTLVPVYRRRK